MPRHLLAWMMTRGVGTWNTTSADNVDDHWPRGTTYMVLSMSPLTWQSYQLPAWATPHGQSSTICDENGEDFRFITGGKWK